MHVQSTFLPKESAMKTSLSQRLTIIGLFAVLVTSTTLLTCASSSTAQDAVHDPVGNALRLPMFDVFSQLLIKK